MNLQFRLLLLLICKTSVMLGEDVQMPPTIIQGPRKDSHDYRDDDDYTLECVAEGSPKPEYEWLKNDELLTNLGRDLILVQNGTGTIRIPNLGTLDEGAYQCRAYNKYGAALTRKIVLRKAVLAQYPTKNVFDAPEQPEGTPYTLRCQPTKCHPKPMFSWALVRGTEDKEDTPVIPDRRIQIDEEGNLHFSYLVTGDSQNEMLYKCRLFNNVMDVTIGGSYSRLKVTPVATIAPFAPKKMFSTESPLVGLENKYIMMKCFFSGNPNPMITWSKDGESLPIGRYGVTNQYSELTIRDLKSSDAGIYRCTAQNTQHQNVSETIEVKIEAVPVFRSSADKPHDSNTTEGSDVVIRCKTYAVPMADIRWFRNGSPLDVNHLPKKFSISADNETLTISNLCKSCNDGTSDLMVIQCNASNPHGYVYEDAYVNVLEKTTITKWPENVTLGLDEDSTEFTVDATTDALTPLTIHWYKIDSPDIRRYLHPDEPYVRISEDKKRVTFFLPSNNSAKRAEYHGLYEVMASNLYSVDVAEIFLDVEVPPVTPPPPGPVQAGIAELWWIIVLAAGIFLLVILILLCCICCYRNRGEVYPVDKKERKNGNDPEKELKDSGFFDYKRPEVLPVKGSRVSLDSIISESDEEASLNEYGDIDAGKFTEEGSFIGDYATNSGPKKNHNHHAKA